MKNRRSVIHAEIEAIELGLVSLAYGLRHTAQVAQELDETTRWPGISKPAKNQAARLCRDDLREILRARKIISKLMQTHGDFRNNTDMCTDAEEVITGPAYSAMYALEKQQKGTK